MTVRSMYVYNGASWDEVGYTIAHGVPAGGASGTILAKSSATDYDTAWLAQSALTIAPSQVTGTAIVSTLADAAGDLVVGSAADTFGRLELGTDNYALTVNTAGSGVAKVGWEDPTANPLTTAAMALKVNTATVGNLLTANQASVDTGVAGDNNSIDGHYPMFASCTVAHSTSQYLVGTGSLEVTAAATDFYVGHGYPATAAVTPGQTITGMFSVKSTGVVANFSVGFRWLTAGGATITDVGNQAIPSTSSWGRRIFTVVVPDTAASVWMYVIGGAATTSSVHYLDCFSLHLGAGGQWALPGTPITNLGFYTDESCGRRLFQWDANNSRWQMTYGETGIRDVASSLETGEGYTTVTNLELRRIGNTVQLQAVTLARGSTGSGDKYCLTLPAGFWPDQTVYFRTGISDCFGYVLAGDGKVYISTASTSDGFTLSWQTTTAWPTTLPGSAVGSIPA